MQDNFNLFEEYLSPCMGTDPSLPGNVYYLASVVNDNGYTIKQYIIEDGYGLKRAKEEIITLCEVFHAKATIDIQPKSYCNVAVAMNKKLADVFADRNYNDIPKLLNSTIEDGELCDEYVTLDIDDSQDPGVIKEWCESYMAEVCLEVKTDTCTELVVYNFDEDDGKRLASEFPKIHINKNGNVLLYYPKSKTQK